MSGKIEQLKIAVNGKDRIIRQIDVYNRNEFQGKYKGHLFYVWKEEDEDRFYMQVWPEEQSFVCDGYCDELAQTINEAIAEAIKGACL